MSTYTVTLKRELDDEFLMDVMVTMIESGSASVHYWGTVANVVRRHTDLSVESFTIEEDDDDDEAEGRITMTPKVVAAAIDRLLNNNELVGSLIRGYIVDAVAMLDAGSIDSDAADCIAQVALFDEVRYG